MFRHKGLETLRELSTVEARLADRAEAGGVGLPRAACQPNSTVNY